MSHMLLRLKEEQSIKVLPADKGLADVVLATDTYQDVLPERKRTLPKVEKRSNRPSDEEVV